jgi:hypothetical protein
MDYSHVTQTGFFVTVKDTQQNTVTDASGNSRTHNVPSSSGWTRRELADIPLSAGTATVTIRASSSNGYLFVDDLGLVRTSGGDTPPPAPTPSSR